MAFRIALFLMGGCLPATILMSGCSDSGPVAGTDAGPDTCQPEECAAQYQDDPCYYGECSDGECLRIPHEAVPPDLDYPCTIDDDLCVVKAACVVSGPDQIAVCTPIEWRDCSIAAEDTDHPRHRDRDCVVPSCDPETGDCVYTPVDPLPGACDDNLACTINTACTEGGYCLGESKCGGDECNHPGDPDCLEPAGLCLYEPKYPTGGGSCTPDPDDLCTLGTCTAATAPYPSACAVAGSVDCTVGDEWSAYCDPTGGQYDQNRCNIYRNRDCLAGTCVPATGECQYLPIDPAPAACDDHLACTLNTACNAQGQCVGEAKCFPDACNDLGDPPCTEPDGTCQYQPLYPSGGGLCQPDPDDLCEVGTCGPATAPAASACQGTGPRDCSIGSDWEAIYCEGGSGPDPTMCQWFRDRDCLIPGCDPDTGECTYSGNGSTSSCDDGLYCTEDESCDGAGHCTGGMSPCAADFCNDLGDPACDDDLDSCNWIPSGESLCIPDPDDLCILGTCSDLGAGKLECWHDPDDPAQTVDCAIDDGWALHCDESGGDYDPVKCARYRNRDCLVPACDPGTGSCTYAVDVAMAGQACDDGLFCTINTFCTAEGECVYDAGTGLPEQRDCAAELTMEPCTLAHCDEDLDSCEARVQPLGEECYTSDYCVLGTCDGLGQNASHCDTTTNPQARDCLQEAIDSGQLPGPYEMYNPECFAELGCDSIAATCNLQLQPDSTPCDTAQFCSTSSCQAGSCEIEQLRDCWAEVAPGDVGSCETVFCDEDNDQCLIVADQAKLGAPCAGDGRFCTTNEVCKACPGVPDNATQEGCVTAGFDPALRGYCLPPVEGQPGRYLDCSYAVLPGDGDCNTGVCVEAARECRSIADLAMLGQACTNTSECRPGSSKVCSCMPGHTCDGTQGTAFCVELSGGNPVLAPDGLPCNTLDPCGQTGVCDGTLGTCRLPGSTPFCILDWSTPDRPTELYAADHLVHELRPAQQVTMAVGAFVDSASGHHPAAVEVFWDPDTREIAYDTHGYAWIPDQPGVTLYGVHYGLAVGSSSEMFHFDGIGWTRRTDLMEALSEPEKTPHKHLLDVWGATVNGIDTFYTTGNYYIADGAYNMSAFGQYHCDIDPSGQVDLCEHLYPAMWELDEYVGYQYTWYFMDGHCLWGYEHPQDQIGRVWMPAQQVFDQNVSPGIYHYVPGQLVDFYGSELPAYISNPELGCGWGLGGVCEVSPLADNLQRDVSGRYDPQSGAANLWAIASTGEFDVPFDQMLHPDHQPLPLPAYRGVIYRHGPGNGGEDVWGPPDRQTQILDVIQLRYTGGVVSNPTQANLNLRAVWVGENKVHFVGVLDEILEEEFCYGESFCSDFGDSSSCLDPSNLGRCSWDDSLGCYGETVCPGLSKTECTNLWSAPDSCQWRPGCQGSDFCITLTDENDCNGHSHLGCRWVDSPDTGDRVFVYFNHLLGTGDFEGWSDPVVFYRWNKSQAPGLADQVNLHDMIGVSDAEIYVVGNIVRKDSTGTPVLKGVTFVIDSTQHLGSVPSRYYGYPLAGGN